MKKKNQPIEVSGEFLFAEKKGGTYYFSRDPLQLLILIIAILICLLQIYILFFKDSNNRKDKSNNNQDDNICISVTNPCPSGESNSCYHFYSFTGSSSLINNHPSVIQFN